MASAISQAGSKSIIFALRGRVLDSANGSGDFRFNGQVVNLWSASAPDKVESHLRAEWGADLSRRVLEVIAVEGYRTSVLSVGQAAEMLGVSVYDADGVLKRHGVECP